VIEMDKLEAIGDQIRQHLEEKNAARDSALTHSRTLIRHCATAIRSIHRNEREAAKEHIASAHDLIKTLQRDLSNYPDLYHAGYTKDALKEYAEASICYALIGGEALPHPEELGVEAAAYLGGLGEAVGELRRRVLDLLRHDEMEEAERLLSIMDDVYGFLVTLDFPKAITGNLRRLNDMVRGVTERTRGDLTTSFQQRELRSAMRAVEKKLDRS
jgi:translin